MRNYCRSSEPNLPGQEPLAAFPLFHSDKFTNSFKQTATKQNKSGSWIGGRTAREKRSSTMQNEGGKRQLQTPRFENKNPKQILTIVNIWNANSFSAASNPASLHELTQRGARWRGFREDSIVQIQTRAYILIHFDTFLNIVKYCEIFLRSQCGLTATDPPVCPRLASYLAASSSRSLN